MKAHLRIHRARRLDFQTWRHSLPMPPADRDALLRQYMDELCRVAIAKLGREKGPKVVCLPGPGKKWITFTVTRINRKEVEVLLTQITDVPTAATQS